MMKYSYDANSNITKVSNPFGEIDHTYDDENRLLTKGQRNFAYDNNGNLVNESIEWNSKKYADTAYSYDPLNRMKSVSRYAGHGYVFKAEYDYDAFNRETSRFFGLEKLPSNENYGNAFKHGAAKYEITAKNSYYHDTTPEVSMETREWSFFGYPIVEKSETQYSGRRLLSRDTGRKAVYYTHDIHESITSAREGFFGFGVTQSVRYGAWGETLSDTFRFDRLENGYNCRCVSVSVCVMKYEYTCVMKAQQTRTQTRTRNLFGYRHYSPFTRQWTSTDPVKDGFNWQTYLGGVADPMNFWDQWGLWPGQRFNNPNAAATDFAINYNDDSIRNNVEYVTTIYKTNRGKYYYGIPNKGNSVEVKVDVSADSESDKKVAVTHTHGAKDKMHKSEEFSPKDKGFAVDDQVVVYVVTPSGEIKLFSYDGLTPTTIKPQNTEIPSDPATGENRKTNVDPNLGEINVYQNNGIIIDSNSNLNREIIGDKCK